MAKYEVKVFLKYNKEHLWVKKVGDNCRIGITDYAQQQQGDILYADLPEEGDEITAGESFGSIESSKAVSELIAPISGTVISVNEEVVDEPEIINNSCYDNGWILEVEASDYDAEAEKLLDAKEYKGMIE